MKRLLRSGGRKKPIEKEIACFFLDVVNFPEDCDKTLKKVSWKQMPKRIIYATSKKEVLEEFKVWKERYGYLSPKAVLCLEKDLTLPSEFYRLQTQHMASISTINLIKRVLRGFLKAYKNGYISSRKVFTSG